MEETMRALTVPEGRVLLVQAQAVDVDKVAPQQRGEGRRHQLHNMVLISSDANPEPGLF
jgi:hypothetical protein